MAVWFFLISSPPPLIAGESVPLERQSNRMHIFIWDVFTDSFNADYSTQTLPPALRWGKPKTFPANVHFSSPPGKGKSRSTLARCPEIKASV